MGSVKVTAPRVLLLLLGVGTLIVVGLSSLPHSQPDPGLREDMILLRDLVGRIVVHGRRCPAWIGVRARCGRSFAGASRKRTMVGAEAGAP